MWALSQSVHRLRMTLRNGHERRRHDAANPSAPLCIFSRMIPFIFWGAFSTVVRAGAKYLLFSPSHRYPAPALASNWPTYFNIELSHVYISPPQKKNSRTFRRLICRKGLGVDLSARLLWRLLSGGASEQCLSDSYSAIRLSYLPLQTDFPEVSYEDGLK